MAVSEAVDEEDADVGETQSYSLELSIDDRLPLTDYPWYIFQMFISTRVHYLTFFLFARCDFIQMGYSVHVVARTHSFYDDIVVKLPIIIDSIVSLL